MIVRSDKQKEKLINSFNREDTCLVISGYPQKDGHGNQYGMSWYTKETIEPLAKEKNAKFVVLAETNGNNAPKIYKDGRILVLRVFDQRHLSLYPYILQWLSRFNKVKRVYVHSEFGANGGVKNFAFLIPFLILIKFTGRKITFFAHNFVENFKNIAPHLGLKKDSFAIKGLNFLLTNYNKLLGIVADRVVVMDWAIKSRAEKYIRPEKIIYYPMFVRRPSLSISYNKARQTLGIKENELVLLYFGFMTYYKGIDWFIDKVSDEKKCFKLLPEKSRFKKIKLIIAGGKAYSLRDKAYYRDFLAKQMEKISGNENIIQTGFLPEGEVSKYFSACDLAVYPYRGLIGASGALSYALSYRKPFLISDRMKEILQNPDFRKGMHQLGIPKDEIIFSLSGDSFYNKINELLKSGKFINVVSLSSYIAQKRDLKKNATAYYEAIYGENKKKLFYYEVLKTYYEALLSKFAVRIE